MAVPFHQTSKTVKRKRRTHFKLSSPTVSVCKNCNEPVMPHRVCKKCGYYDNRKVI